MQSNAHFAKRAWDEAFDEDATPSRRQGLSREKEAEYRQAYTQLIIDVGQRLELCAPPPLHLCGRAAACVGIG